MKNKLLKFLGAISLHEYLKDKATKRAKEKLRKEESIDNQFYVSLPEKRDWIQLDSGMNNQTFRVAIMRIKNFIENFGGYNTKVVDSTVDTRIYFDMPRSSVDPMFADLKRRFEKITLGEVKLKQY